MNGPRPRPLVRLLPLIGTLIGTQLGAGCVSTAPKQESVEPFLFRSLDLRQQDGKGLTAWSLTSPEARYDINKRLAKARQPRGLIFRNGQPLYDIHANGGTVLNNGEVIQLEGSVEVTLLGPDPVAIHADQLRWIPRRDLMEIDRRPWASDHRTRLSAASARFYVQQDRLELSGKPQLRQWADAPRGRPDPVGLGPADVILTVAAATWHPRTGVLQASGPVQGERHEPNRSGQTLRASALAGNLRQQVLGLEAPVQVADQGRQALLEAQRTIWNLAERRLESDHPFRARIDRMQVSGARFGIDLDRETATVPQACQVLQPGDQLSADQCIWQWSKGEIGAQGSVLLRRKANGQITRAERLQGRIGKNGLAVFSAPGSRVSSQLTLPAQGGSLPPRSRLAVPPVTF